MQEVVGMFLGIGLPMVLVFVCGIGIGKWKERARCCDQLTASISLHAEMYRERIDATPGSVKEIQGLMHHAAWRALATAFEDVSRMKDIAPGPPQVTKGES